MRHWSSVAAKDARRRLAELESVIPADWRLTWYSGQCALLEGDFDAAAASFDAVLTMLPGELDPKLALAATAELRGAYDEAARYYETVWRTNHSFYSAAFGLARLRARAGDRAGAIATLDQITTASAHFTAAGTTAIEILLDGRTADNVDEPTLLDAGKRASTLTLESATKRATIRLKVLGAALDWLEAGNTPKAARLYGADFDRAGIRIGMEQSLPRAGARGNRHVGAHHFGGEGKCDPAEDQVMNGQGVKCMQCGATVMPAERFCESCGSHTVRSPPSRPSRAGTSLEAPCADCGNETYVDDYCTECGNRRAEPARDQADLDGIVLITDRGLEHPRNEDAAAAGIVGLRCRAKRSPLPCATGCRHRQPLTRRRRRLDRPGSTRCSMRLPLNGSRESAVLGRPDRCRQRGGGRRSRQPGSGHGAVVHLRGGGRRSDLDGHSRDRRRQRRGQQGVLASRTPDARAVPDSRRFRLRRN